MSFINTVVSLLPAPVVRGLGRLQFRIPLLRSLIQRYGHRLTEQEGVIRHGIGKGLRFRATGGYPGYLLGTSEPEEQALLAKLLFKGGVFYDIGANIGFYSTLAARIVGPEGRVFAFEPFPVSANSCRHNATLNHFNHVEVVEAAVGREAGTVSLEMGDSSAMHRVSDAKTGHLVSMIAIDQWRTNTSSRIPPPDLVLIDVEGAELQVLEGMLDTIRESLPAMMIEVHWLGETFPAFFEKLLRPLGYRMTTYGGGSIPAGMTRYHALLIARSKARSNPSRI